MIPAEVKLALYRIALYCKEFREKSSFCYKECPLYNFCANAFDLEPWNWEKWLAEEE